MSFKIHFTKVLCGMIVGATGFIGISCAQTIGQNIALHDKVTITPASNSSANKNNDPQLLTDGIYASTGGAWNIKNQKLPLWQQAGTLGWRLKGKAIITIDLGSDQPISGVIFSTGAGGKSTEGWGIPWPKSIYIATSNDNKTWYYVGDLVELSQKNGVPPESGDANFRYITHDLKTHGRYLSLGVVGYPYIFADEVEVLRGDDALLKQSAGTPTQSMEEFVLQNQITEKAKQRQDDDIDSIRALLKKAAISATQKSTFEARLTKDAAATKDMALQPVDFKTIIPITETHRDVLSVHGEALQAQGFKPLTIWKKQRYAWLSLINVPELKQPVSLMFSMLKNEIRNDAVLLTNASGKPMKVKVQLQNSPHDAESDWLQLSHAIWTDTLNNLPVQSALIPLQTDSGSYSFEIPAGVTGKLWVTIDSSKIPAGTYKSTFAISGGGEDVQVPIDINVSKIAMERPRLSLTMWDFTHDETSRYGINANTMPAAINMMQSHYVDTPVASGLFGIGTPVESDFNENNHLRPNTKLDFTKFDRWIKRWPDARHYLIYYSVNANYSFAGAKMGTPIFNARFGSYIKTIADHAKTLGIQPSQLLFCFKDEPHDDEGNITMMDLASALKSVASEVGVFSNPQWRDPTKAKDQNAFLLPDILCTSGIYAMDFYEKLRRDHGRQLWFYTTPPGVHALDPQGFYRDYAWEVFAMHGVGEGWWAFGDTTTPTSWNAYNSAYGGYSPVFLDEDHVYNSIHWEAVREGVEDFEILSMLNDAIQKSANPQQKERAQKILDAAVTIAKKNYNKGQWPSQTDPDVVDAELTKVRDMLEQMDQ